eukprot:TRINITY_DN2152_c0_g1_i3.p1 TRINITY_DN2152_c0_g1~~TRINITY_DN2152_c0_g1_i3.p1  ORF type:complete len:340 (+),score=185.60 TRINITY_DN2152_c0_g1_i3:60-1079(+)
MATHSEDNESWLFNKRPVNEVTEEVFRKSNWPTPGELENGQVLIRTTYISVDPYMRIRMNEKKNYFEGFKLNEPFDGGVTGEVISSKFEGLVGGDRVLGFLPWSKYTVADGSKLVKIPNVVTNPSYMIGGLGMPGLSAYLPITKIGQVQAGNTALVSGAAGAVGTIAGQIFKILGCSNVVGIAGSNDKCQFVEQLGYDKCINYRNENLHEALTKAFPDGIDIYFDNVGGETLEIVLEHMKKGGRIIACGSISQYNINDVSNRYAIRNLFYIVTKSLKMQGFIVYDWFNEFPIATNQLIDWYSQGKLKINETVIEGFDKIPIAMIGLFQGDNFGKMVVKV